jgi:Na+(H+)/acetate symporter ActP
MLAAVDPWILAFSLLTVAATLGMGFWAAGKSRTASDFFVAGRGVSVGWNASAISGEYLSAASFMGVAGMVMSSGYDALWYPVCYACGYLFLLLFIAGPLRRFGAYTIPDFAEGRYDSPLFRKVAVVFVLFIGFFYTMPQMKGAGTTLAYIFQDIEWFGQKGLPYWVGVVLVGAVITFNVALGGMKGITLVQAFQYWMKMFAISVPVFVLMAVHGHYGRQLRLNGGGDAERISPKAAQFLDRARMGPPEPADVVMVSDGSSPFDSGLGPYAFTVFNDLKDDFGRESLKSAVAARDLRTAAQAIRGDELYGFGMQFPFLSYGAALQTLGQLNGWRIITFERQPNVRVNISKLFKRSALRDGLIAQLRTNGIVVEHLTGADYLAFPSSARADYAPVVAWLSGEGAGRKALNPSEPERQMLPAKASKDEAWLNPFGPLTTKAAKAARPRIDYDGPLIPVENIAVAETLASFSAMASAPFTNRLPASTLVAEFVALRRLDHAAFAPALTNLWIDLKATNAISLSDLPDTLIAALEKTGVAMRLDGGSIIAVPAKEARITPVDPRPYALLYTYSLIIALVCGTAGLPHILVRFYTNPDGVAAKRTTMWVMILIGVFYLFPPVFGVFGRNLLPALYAGTGAKGTDKIVLELPRILGSNGGVWGSIFSGITCAGAFAAFMSTFSGLLVSMTGALAHDVYGRILRPQSTPGERMRMFKWCAVAVGLVATLLGCRVEPLQINFMVGQAFAIAAASYFPLLFMSVWWRSMTMPGAAAGMLAGGLSALIAVSLTNFSDLGWINLKLFWSLHPLARILCEQPAIWCVPMAIGLMVLVSLRTSRAVPADIRMKMLVLHAPEDLGLKQEYIREHETHGH